MFYSAAIGRKTGVFLDWMDCAESVQNYSGAIFRKWKMLREATQHLNKHGIRNDAICVHTSTGPIPLEEYCQSQSILLPEEVEHERRTLFRIGWGLFVEIVNGEYTFFLSRMIKLSNV